MTSGRPGPDWLTIAAAVVMVLSALAITWIVQ